MMYFIRRATASFLYFISTVLYFTAVYIDTLGMKTTSGLSWKESKKITFNKLFDVFHTMKQKIGE